MDGRALSGSQLNADVPERRGYDERGNLVGPKVRVGQQREQRGVGGASPGAR